MVLLYEEKSYRLLLPTSFRVYKDRIEAYFFPYKHVIPLSDIKGVKIIEKIPWYVGWGLRINPLKRRLYFVTHHGKSILIERYSGFWREIVLSVKDPQRFASHIKIL